MSCRAQAQRSAHALSIGITSGEPEDLAKVAKKQDPGIERSGVLFFAYLKKYAYVYDAYLLTFLASCRIIDE